MVSGPAVADAIERARRLPTLRVGLHLALVDARPTLSPAQLPDFVDGNGWLRGDMAALGTQIFLRPKMREQLAAEIAAQFDAFAATGLPLDHVNAHHHFHVHPTVAGAVINVGRQHGLRALRVPREPLSALDAIEPGRKHARDWRMGPWLALLGTRARAHGLLVPDRVFGLAWSGAMTERRLAGLLHRLPTGVTEIYAHPATTNEFAGATAGYRYRDELEALTSREIREAAHASGARIGGFGDFLSS